MDGILLEASRNLGEMLEVCQWAKIFLGISKKIKNSFEPSLY